ncbi:Retrovirus-related Pol polyprotein [Ceratobasidium theobromae]|uniref:Retrovirus-related Pol polyprotein n=1 Tax=Ceratobasidium theobromae TaxID=1582974 RepID=A0A5N5QFT8_9AGAM|nr:Retrovirus-related Pol polyprotein [Ceratobasidium theobromae]
MCQLQNRTGKKGLNRLREQEREGKQEKTWHDKCRGELIMRRQDPFIPGQVVAVLGKVRIGQGLSDDQRKMVKALVEEFANIFALDLTKMPHSRIPNTFPATVSPSNVVPKPGGAEEPSLEYLHMLANRACEEVGLPVKYPLENQAPLPPAAKETKFCLVHNFAKVNEVTKVPAFPMGDLAAKQQAVAGYQFISTIDFASGFNTLPMEESSIKYTGFYVKGKGHYVYPHMPFGLTSTPTTFCKMLADTLHNLLGEGMEIWMDDIGLAANSLEEGLASLFMDELVFAGAKVSIKGIQPDRTKVQAILQWPEPKSVLEVMGLLGLTRAFRSKIKNYVCITQPLSDLTRNMRVERRGDGKSKKGEYKRALQNTEITLSEEVRKVIVELKVALTTNPVLRAPVYDSRSFLIVSDRSKYGFGAMVAQKWEEADAKGRKKLVTYPIAFMLKHTSCTEENYPPFLLEFAALKFTLDSFAQIIMGQELEIETDCKALADLLGNKKLNLTHERWRESIIAHRIITVRHQPGVENPVCDTLSRKWQYRENKGEGREDSVDPSWEAHKGLVEEMNLLVEDSEAREVLDRFEGDDYFGEIVRYLVLGLVDDEDMTPSNIARVQERAAHRVVGFEVAEGKLWRVAGKAANYLSLPTGTRGYKTVLLIIDVYSRFVFGFVTRGAGTGAYTVECLDKLGDIITTPIAPMSDNGSHFDCGEVHDWAKRNNIKLIHSPAYTPSVNGLVEDANKILLGRLCTLCAEDVGEARGSPDRPPTPLPRSWPKFLQVAIHQMNDRVMPSLGYTSRKLITGVLTSDRRYEAGTSIRHQYNPSNPTANPIDVNMALTYALRCDSEERTLAHARNRKHRFDEGARLLMAEPGDLVQKYDARWDATHSSQRKLAPKWSPPLQVKERRGTSYVLEDLQRQIVSTGTHAKHLRFYTPRPGSQLAEHISSKGTTPPPELTEVAFGREFDMDNDLED